MRYDWFDTYVGVVPNRGIYLTKPRSSYNRMSEDDVDELIAQLEKAKEQF